MQWLILHSFSYIKVARFSALQTNTAQFEMACCDAPHIPNAVTEPELFTFPENARLKGEKKGLKSFPFLVGSNSNLNSWICAPLTKILIAPAEKKEAQEFKSDDMLKIDGSPCGRFFFKRAAWACSMRSTLSAITVVYVCVNLDSKRKGVFGQKWSDSNTPPCLNPDWIQTVYHVLKLWNGLIQIPHPLFESRLDSNCVPCTEAGKWLDSNTPLPVWIQSSSHICHCECQSLWRPWSLVSIWSLSEERPEQRYFWGISEIYVFLTRFVAVPFNRIGLVQISSETRTHLMVGLRSLCVMYLRFSFFLWFMSNEWTRWSVQHMWFSVKPGAELSPLGGIPTKQPPPFSPHLQTLSLPRTFCPPDISKGYFFLSCKWQYFLKCSQKLIPVAPIMNRGDVYDAQHRNSPQWRN